MQPVLIQRFIINLRRPTETDATQYSMQLRTTNFRLPDIQNIVGNLGESVQFAHDDDEVTPNEETEPDAVHVDEHGAGSLHNAEATGVLYEVEAATIGE